MDHRPLEDWEYPEPDEFEGDELSETLPCPNCEAEVYEDLEQCPVCGEYVDFSTAPLSSWPWWTVALGLLGVVAVMWSLTLM